MVKIDKEKPRFLQGSARTVLFPDSSVSGKLSFNLPVKIDSRFTGEVKATELLVLGPNAEVEARVVAGDLQVEGSLVGTVRVAGCIEILPGGRFRGEIEAGQLWVHPGGVFEGKGQITNGEAGELDQLPGPSSP